MVFEAQENERQTNTTIMKLIQTTTIGHKVHACNPSAREKYGAGDRGGDQSVSQLVTDFLKCSSLPKHYNALGEMSFPLMKLTLGQIILKALINNLGTSFIKQYQRSERKTKNTPSWPKMIVPGSRVLSCSSLEKSLSKRTTTIQSAIQLQNP